MTIKIRNFANFFIVRNFVVIWEAPTEFAPNKKRVFFTARTRRGGHSNDLDSAHKAHAMFPSSACFNEPSEGDMKVTALLMTMLCN